jgi:hypothetical protein
MKTEYINGQIGTYVGAGFTGYDKENRYMKYIKPAPEYGNYIWVEYIGKDQSIEMIVRPDEIDFKTI